MFNRVHSTNLAPMIRQALITSLLTLALPLATLAHCLIMPLTMVVLAGESQWMYVPMAFSTTVSHTSYERRADDTLSY